MLSVNSRGELFDLVDILTMIVRNILSHPSDVKYRVIKLTNKVIQSRLVGRKGGIEFLSAAGFIAKTLDAQKVLELVGGDGDHSAAEMTELEESLSWLTSTVDTCNKMADVSKRLPAESCASVVVQLRFPTGQTVVGGFTRTDHARDVLSFACCFYHADKADLVQLRESHNAKAALGYDDLEKSLQDLGLFPRVTLMVDTLNETERAVSVCETRTKVTTDIKLQKARAEQLRKQKIANLLTSQEERKKLLLSFKDDRLDQRDRDAFARVSAETSSHMDVDQTAEQAAAAESTAHSAVQIFPPGRTKHNLWVDGDEDLARVVEEHLQRARRRPSTSSPIPCLLHFIWLGSPLPTVYETTIDSWRQHHPHWEIKIWSDADVESVMGTGRTKEAFQGATNWGTKSDILRYEVLCRYGGLYVDVDYECIGNIDPLCVRCSLFAGASNTSAMEVNNGLVGCVPHHPVVEALLDLIAKETTVDAAGTAAPIQTTVGTARVDTSIFQSFLSDADNHAMIAALSTSDDFMRTIRATGPGLFTRTIYRCLSSPAPPTAAAARKCASDHADLIESVLILPFRAFTPVPNSIGRVNLQDREVTAALKRQHLVNPAKGASETFETTYAVHWWQRSWQTVKQSP